MRKQSTLTIIAIAMLLVSCDFPFFPKDSDSITISDSEQESISARIKESDTISETVSQYISNHSFIKPQEIYLDIDETYNLSKMLPTGLNINDAFIDGSSISYEKGILKGLDYGDSNLIITKDELCQVVPIHVVDYFEYGSYFTSMDLGRFYGKNVVMFGDSITHNWNKYTHNMELTHPENPNYDYGYSGWVGIMNDRCKFASITNAACSGGTMAIPQANKKYVDNEAREQRKSFPYCVDHNLEAVEKADYIFIFYGTNDYSAQLPLGAILDETPTNSETPASFAASLKYGLDQILSVNSNAKIFICSTLYRTLMMYSTGYKLKDINDLIEDLAEAYMIHYVDLYNLFSPSEFSKYSSDGLHPNDLGAQMIVDYFLSDGGKYDEN